LTLFPALRKPKDFPESSGHHIPSGAENLLSFLGSAALASLSSASLHQRERIKQLAEMQGRYFFRCDALCLHVAAAGGRPILLMENQAAEETYAYLTTTGRATGRMHRIEVWGSRFGLSAAE
jgi:hypothetical protein